MIPTRGSDIDKFIYSKIHFTFTILLSATKLFFIITLKIIKNVKNINYKTQNKCKSSSLNLKQKNEGYSYTNFLTRKHRLKSTNFLQNHYNKIAGANNKVQHNFKSFMLQEIFFRLQNV
ncbi:unnamed protein product [Chrysodeixis includens]|uniref:Uncharacterized protein n=1 Tax=Chrysodeixis includens TaxID=689277 RepID=A0A9P0BKZ2_CHRIL|nr:unnamed protein product [Chrysodeixis includens]